MNNPSNENRELETCSICLGEIDPEHTLKTACNHLFHCNCLEQWLEKHTRCPLCRKELYDGVSDDELLLFNDYGVEESAVDDSEDESSEEEPQERFCRCSRQLQEWEDGLLCRDCDGSDKGRCVQCGTRRSSWYVRYCGECELDQRTRRENEIRERQREAEEHQRQLERLSSHAVVFGPGTSGSEGKGEEGASIPRLCRHNMYSIDPEPCLYCAAFNG